VTIPYHTKVGVGLAAALALLAAPLSAQQDEAQEVVWRIGGLRNGFCVLFLVDPQLAAKNLPAGLRVVTAGEAADLHPALKSEIEAQPELGTWSPSHLCFYSVDTIQTDEYVLADKHGRKSQLLALWTVSAAEAGSGKKRDIALLMLTNSSRLVRSGRLAGQTLHEVKATLGLVPEVDENGEPSKDNRFQVKVGKTLVTWDGRHASDSAAASGSVAIAWAARANAPSKGRGSLTLAPVWASPMVGALKVEGKDDLATALQGSPLRFVGPLYRGGSGEIRLTR
jgi:hypothetical protein